MAGQGDRFPQANRLLGYFTRHATAANLVLVLLIAAGLAALPRMRAQYFPDVIIQQINVGVDWKGAGPEDVDRGITQLLEPGLMAVEGVDNATSYSREGGMTVILEFEPGWDMSRALNDVETAVASVTNLPQDADTPQIVRRAWRDRVSNVVMSGPVSPAQLLQFGDEFLLRLFAAGVTRATIEDLPDPEMRIEVPLAELIRHDLTLSQIAQRIGAEVNAAPAGEVTDGSSRLRAGAERRSATELGDVVLKSAPDGTNLRLADIARVHAVGSQEIHSVFVGPNPAISLRIDRSAQGDSLDIQATVEKVAEEMRQTLPAGVTIDMIRVRSDDIRARLDILIQNGAMGLGLVIAILFLFLNARTAFWVAAGIPVAMLAAVAMMQAFGLTFNMISLFALILTLGIVVDDAIVIGEHTDFRVRRLGEPPLVAAETAVSRMAAPVLSSTLTTIAAFLGLTALSGRFGDMLQDIPFTVSVVLAASVIECFLILPNHMAHALSKASRGHWYDAPSRVVNRGFGWVRDRGMRPLTRFVLWARYPVLAAAIALLCFQAAKFIRGDVPWRFFNSPEQSTIDANFTMLPGATRADSEAVMRALQDTVAKVAQEYRDKYGVEPLKFVTGEVGSNVGRGLSSSENTERDLKGAVSIELGDPDLRPWTSNEFVASLQEAAPHSPLINELAFRGGRWGPAGDDIDVELSGNDATTLKQAAEALKRALVVFPEVSSLEDSLPYDKNELILTLTPQGRALGFTVDSVGAELRHRLDGVEAASFPDGTRSMKVMVKLPERDLTSDFIDRTLLRTPSGGYVPLSDIVTFDATSGFSKVVRENGKQVVSVTGAVSEDNADRLTEILDRLDKQILPDIASEYGVTYDLSGLSEQETQFLNDAVIGLTAALLAIYAILAWIFSSWTRPVVVMLVIPLGLIGAVYGHDAWGVPVSMFSIVGMIGMSGIIINDAIVLISTIDEYAERRGLIPSIIDGVADRLRPVFLTTATTVLGLAPLLFESSRQAQFLKPTVITLCYGLGFGMVLVLLIVPAMIGIQHDLSRHLRAYRRARRAAPIRRVVQGAALAMVAVFAATLGVAIWTAAPLVPAMIAFALGALAVAVLGWAIGAMVLRRDQPAQP
ncbi:MAG: efflux RND transporter permease subunit [Defluviimonas denitrificans]